MDKKIKATKKTASKKSNAFQSPKGMHDIFPADFVYIDKIEKEFKKISAAYGFERIETPVMENIHLFERGAGIASEVVSKQMFIVKTKSEDVLALRPEMTPGVMRAYLQSGASRSQIPGKYFYISPIFRYEQPQAGRFRQFNQAGFEILHSDDPAYDAQVILACYKMLEELKIKGILVKINSIGCKNCRPGYIKKLKDFYKNKTGKICRDCSRRLSENPLRLLDCKEEKCQPFKASAPQSVDYLCGSCKHHFKSVLEFLNEVTVPYIIDSSLVRGLDYYSKTVFELFAEEFAGALGGGGRYDYLSEAIGGPRMAAVGAAMGVERIASILKEKNINIPVKNHFKVFLIYMGDEAKKKAFKIISDFYDAGVAVKESFSKESLKGQLRMADKEKVEYVLILGQREVFEDVIILRNMITGNQENIPIKKIVDEVKRRIK